MSAIYYDASMNQLYVHSTVIGPAAFALISLMPIAFSAFFIYRATKSCKFISYFLVFKILLTLHPFIYVLEKSGVLPQIGFVPIYFQMFCVFTVMLDFASWFMLIDLKSNPKISYLLYILMVLYIVAQAFFVVVGIPSLIHWFPNLISNLGFQFIISFLSSVYNTFVLILLSKSFMELSRDLLIFYSS